MEPVFKLKFQNTSKQFEDLTYATYKLSHKKLLLLIRIIGGIIATLMLLDTILYIDIKDFTVPSLLLLDLIQFLFIGGFFCVVLAMSSSRILSKFARRSTLKINRNPFQTIEYEFYEDYFVEKNEFGREEKIYAVITQPVMTEKTIMLYISRIQAYILVKDYFSETGIKKFQAFIEEKSGKKFIEI